MDVLDRNKSPQINQIEKIDVIRASETKLKLFLSLCYGSHNK